MNRERSWVLVFLVAAIAIALSLAQAWNSMRDPAPGLTEAERRQLYESNLRNFAESCEGRAGDPANAGLKDFCRKQAQLLRMLSECTADCQRRTATFTRSDPSK